MRKYCKSLCTGRPPVEWRCIAVVNEFLMAVLDRKQTGLLAQVPWWQP